jgi:surfactin synthase thioesterase subunit/glycosyltransferase involved in cell wall biosynthesis
MRVLLGSNALYYPAHGGGERSNRLLLEGLSQRGHKCFVITRIDRFAPEGDRNLRQQLDHRHIPFRSEAGGLRFELNGVEVLTATSTPSFRAFFVEHKNGFRPDVIITSTDDPAQLLLEAAVHDEHAPTVFLTRATIALPFGPDAAFPSREKTQMLAHADGIVGVSNYVARYVREHSGIEAIHLPISPQESGPHPRLGRFENEFVTLVNPCAVKGIAIFTELAKAMPDVKFAGVPTWGTTSEDLNLMHSISNITLLPKTDDVNQLLDRTRVLLAPSLWAEARSRIVVEAMLAGVPVIASNLGGLPEAKMGVPYVLPANQIVGYQHRLNEQFVPVADVPPQDLEPWRMALALLTSDRQHWEYIAQLSRDAALRYTETTTVEPFERYLSTLTRKPRSFATEHVALPSEQLGKLSPERRKLLELKLRKQGSAGASNPALPLGGTDPSRFRLFCFSHAGGGASFFRAWRGKLGAHVEVAPVQYPGHESRRAEPFARSIEELVESLLRSLKTSLNGQFAFFGHSMGAIVAFELMRALRREALPLPQLLLASGARAPQYRLNHKAPPDPSREELLHEVHRLGGLPRDAMEDPAFLENIVPALEADAAVYRRFVYEGGVPFDVPIAAMGGIGDTQVSHEHLAAWREQSNAEFQMRQFAGGHFFLRTQQDEVLAWIRERCEYASVRPIT